MNTNYHAISSPAAPRLGELPRAELARQLREDGVQLRLGPFAVRIRSPLRIIHDHLLRCYREFTVEPPPWREIPHFHAAIEPGSGLRRWLGPQAVFVADGPSPFHPFPRDHAPPLLEWGLNWVIATQANHFLLLHAAAVAKGERLILLPGRPGSGKSTLCAALVAAGWRLFSDEFAIVTPGTNLVVPLPRPIPLKNQSIPLLRNHWPAGELGPEYPKTRKGVVAHLVPPAASVATTHGLIPVAVVRPEYRPAAPTLLTRLAPEQGFLRLAGNSFNYKLLGAEGFQSLAALIGAARCYHLSFSELTAAVNQLELVADHDPE